MISWIIDLNKIEMFENRKKKKVKLSQNTSQHINVWPAVQNVSLKEKNTIKSLHQIDTYYLMSVW